MAQSASLIHSPEDYVESGTFYPGAAGPNPQLDSPISRSGTGLVLTEASLTPVYANAEAIQILAYPDDPDEITALDSFLAEKLQALLLTAPAPTKQGFLKEFQSGRRRYECRAFPLNSGRAGSFPGRPAVAFLLERKSRAPFDAAGIGARYRLTLRECEVLHYVTYGLTNKEIGRRMSLSPHTVKAFLKLVMMKMGVRNRSGAIRKALDFRE